MRALVATAVGCVGIDLESGDATLVDEVPPRAEELDVSLPLVIAAGRIGARIVAVVRTRPPLVISDDAGQTWRTAGGGLPAGVAVAIDEDDPDRLLFASESRLFCSDNGGIFWRALPTELIGITAVAFA